MVRSFLIPKDDQPLTGFAANRRMSSQDKTSGQIGNDLLYIQLSIMAHFSLMGTQLVEVIVAEEQTYAGTATSMV